MEECVWSRGSFEEAKKFLDNLLEELGYNTRTTWDIDNVYVYRSGFREVAKLSFYGEFVKICGSSEFVEEVRSRLKQFTGDLELVDAPVIHTGIGERFNPLSRLGVLLDERRVLVKKCRMCRALIPISFLGFLLITGLGLLYGKALDEVIGVAIGFLLFILIIPIKPRYMTHLPWVQGILCPRYWRKLRRVDDEINKLLSYLPRDHPLRREVWENLRG